MFRKEKIVGFDEDGTEKDLKSFIENEIKSCQDCEEVLALKNRGEPRGGLTWIKDEDVPEVLRYGDKYHTGYYGINRVIRSWCDFNDYEKKVNIVHCIALYCIDCNAIITLCR